MTLFFYCYYYNTYKTTYTLTYTFSYIHLRTLFTGFFFKTRQKENSCAITVFFTSDTSDTYSGAIHLTKISGNSGTKSNGTERFWKFVSKIVDNPPEVVLFSGNLEIQRISCSIWHFYPVRIDPSSFSREKLQDGGE